MMRGDERLPCVQCGGRLYYHERHEEVCTQCARKLGIDRDCDKFIRLIREAEEEKLN